MQANPGNKFLVNDEFTERSQSTYPSSIFDGISVELTRSAQSIAMDASGDFVVVWASQGQDNPTAPTTWGVYARRYTRDGIPKEPAFLVNTLIPRSQVAPSVASDGAGNFVVTWSSNFAAEDNDGFGIYARRFSSSGAAIDSQEFLVNQTTANGQINSAIAIDQSDDASDANDGGFVITWTDQGNDGNGLGVYARRFSQNGQPIGSDILVNAVGTSPAQTAGDQLNSRVAIAADGSFVVVWESSQGDGPNAGYGIFAQRFDALGNALGDRIQVNSFTAGDQRLPTVAVAADGSFVVAWSSLNQVDFGGWDVFYRRFNPNGTPATPERRANIDATGNQRDAMIALSPNGRFIITWSDPDAAGGMYGRRFDASGNPMGGTDGDEFRIDRIEGQPSEDLFGTGRYGAIAAVNDRFAAVWSGDDGDEDGVIGRVYSIAPTTGNTPPADITLTPVVGPLPSVAENDRGAVIGTLAAVDPEGDSITFSVNDPRFEVNGNQLKLRGDATTGTFLNFENPAEQSIAVIVTATDNGNPSQSSTQTFTITTRNVNEAPESIALEDYVIPSENSPAGTLVGRLTAIDPEGDPITFAIANNPFYELRNGNEIVVKAGANLDFENPLSRLVQITVTASDSASATSAPQTFQIVLQDVNEVPVDIQLSPSAVAENAPGAIIGRVTAIDPENVAPILSVADNRFEIDAQGNLKLRAGIALDYESLTSGELEVDIIAADGQDATLQTIQTVTIQVTDVNEPPTSITLSGLQQVTENTPGAVIGRVSFVDPERDPQDLTVVGDSRFEIDAQGDLKLRAGVELDREAAPIINITVRASDRNTPSLFSERTFPIEVLNQNEAPNSITLAATSVDENVPGAIVGAVTATDPDGTVPILIVSDPRFVIENGVLRLRDGESLNFEALPNGKLDLTITAIDSEGGQLSIDRAFEITVNNINEAPVFITAPANGNVQNGAAGAIIGGTIAFSDPDNDPVTLSVDDPRFEVVQINSEWRLKLRQGESLLFNDAPQVTVNLIASDGTEQTVRPVVIDVVEPGTPTDITLSNRTIDEATPEAIVGTVTVADEDSTTHTFTLSDSRFAIVEVNGQYQLRLAAGQPPLDFETAAGNRTIPLQITATDIDGRSFTQSFEIEIRNINEDPTDITLDSLTVDEQLNGADIGAIAVVDPDIGDSFIYSFSDPRFEVRNGRLKLRDDASLDINSESAIDLTVTATDSGSLTVSRTFRLVVESVNFAPTDITLSSNTIDEDADGAIVGQVIVADPDAGDRHTFTVDNDARFTVDDQGNLRLVAGQQIDFETEPQILLTITATDNGNPARSFTRQNILISVNNLNDAPRLSFIPAQAIPENAAGIPAGTIAAVDPEGNALTFTITGALSDRFEIVGNQLKLRDGESLDFESLPNGAVNLTVTATDNGSQPRTSDPLEVVFQVTDVNEAPTALNLSNLTVTELQPGAEVGLVQVTDPDRPTVEQFRYEVDDPRFEIVNGRLKLRDGVSLDTNVSETVRVRITAFDRGDLPISNDFDITVAGVNQAPTGITLTGSTIAENTLGAIVGAIQVTDPDRSDSHTFEISDSRFVIDAQGNLRLRPDVALDFEAEPTITLQIVAIDSGDLRTPPQTFTIAVQNQNEAPTDITLIGNRVAENAIGAVIGTVQVTDPDSQQFTFSVSDPRFTIVNGQLRLAEGQQLDFEAGAEIQVAITAIDNGNPAGSFTKTFPIEVTNVNEAPTEIRLSNRTVAENTPGAIVGQLTAIDPEPGDTHTFTVSDSRFEVDGQGRLKLRQGQSLDRESGSQITLSITATDSGSQPEQLTQQITLDVTNVNEAPTGITLSNRTVAENAAGAIIGSLTVIDPDAGDTHTFTVSDSRFEVDGQGNLKLRQGQSLDFESGSQITLSITATDSGNPSESFTQQFVLDVTNGNEAPIEIQLQNSSVAENSPGAIVGRLTVIDPDPNDVHTFTVSDSRFEVDAQGNLKLRQGISLDAEATPAIALDITARDREGLERTQSLSIRVTDQNEAPTSLTLEGNTVNENASPNTPIGTFRAVDSEGGVFSYTLAPGEADNDTFTISGDRLLVKNPLDFETKSAYSIRVTVTDSGGLSRTETFEIRVNNVNESPILSPTTGTLIYRENAGAVAIDPALTLFDADSPNLNGAIVRLIGYLPDQDQLSFTPQSGIGGQFDAATGILTLQGTAAVSAYQAILRSIVYRNDSENPDPTNRVVQISVSDGTLTSPIASRTIQIAPVNDAPIVVPSVAAVTFSREARLVELDANIDVIDADSTLLNGATIALEGYVPGEDNLLFSDQSGIVGSFNGATGVLTLTGTASLDDYRQALRSIVYINSRQPPTPRSRFAVVTVNDGSSSSPARIELQFQQIPAAPVVDLNGSEAGNDFSSTFAILGQSVAVTSSETQLTDADSPILTAAQVIITNLFDPNSEALLVDTTGTEIAASYDRATGTLTLSGAAPLSDYLSVMQRIRYQNTSAAPDLTTRVISFRVSDGDRLSNVAQTTVQITDIRLNDGTGAGDMSLVTTPGTDLINALDGNDTVLSILANLQQDDLIDGGTGIDTLVLTDGAGNARIDIANPVNQVSGVLINSTKITSFEQFNWAGFGGNITLIGSEANDVVIAGSGADNLAGNGGSDRLIGNGGNDRLDGGAEADFLDGGAGDDFYGVDHSGDQVIELANGGFDTVAAAIDYRLPDHVEDLILTGSAIGGIGNALDNSLTGNSLNNTLTGNLGDDILVGNDGSDTLVGDSGDDLLIGGRGGDRLIGGDGNDRLEGGPGRDRLTGGKGRDGFVLTSSMRSNRDVITDFNAKDDTILISRRSFGRDLRRGRVRADRFVLGSRAQDASDRFVYSNGSLFFDPDGSGAANQILIARLANRPTIGRSDLRIVQ